MGLLLTTNAALVAEVLRSGDQPDFDSVVRAIAATRSLAAIVDDTLRSLVHQARAGGRTWAEVGDLLGVIRQAAFQRFAAGSGTGIADADDATATAGARSAAEAALDAFLDARFETMRERFDARMLKAAPVALLDSSRATLEDELGSVQAHATPRLHARARYTVADIPVTFERGERTVRIVFDADGQIAGFFLLDGP
jgi:hypothetical protein